MIKYISCHDFHFDPSWSDISRQCGEAVARAAEEHGADFIVTSDLFNRPLYASDKGGLNVLRGIVRSWGRRATTPRGATGRWRTWDSCY